jgi:hypothetical protein
VGGAVGISGSITCQTLFGIVPCMVFNTTHIHYGAIAHFAHNKNGSGFQWLKTIILVAISTL